MSGTETSIKLPADAICASLRAIARCLGLEEYARTRGGAVARFSSRGEKGELQRLVAKYGEDVDAMACRWSASHVLVVGLARAGGLAGRAGRSDGPSVGAGGVGAADRPGRRPLASAGRA